jgi:hypothetical protein
MNRSSLVASAVALALLYAPDRDSLAMARFDADLGSGTSYSCQMEKGVFVEGSAKLPTYRAAGSCNTAGTLTGRWQATGTFDRGPARRLRCSS